MELTTPLLLYGRLLLLSSHLDPSARGDWLLLLLLLPESAASPRPGGVLRSGNARPGGVLHSGGALTFTSVRGSSGAPKLTGGDRRR